VDWKKTRLKPEEILVVGDRPAREIRAGRELGMHTVRLRHGEAVEVDRRARTLSAP